MGWYHISLHHHLVLLIHIVHWTHFHTKLKISKKSPKLTPKNVQISKNQKSISLYHFNLTDWRYWITDCVILRKVTSWTKKVSHFSGANFGKSCLSFSFFLILVASALFFRTYHTIIHFEPLLLLVKNFRVCLVYWLARIFFLKRNTFKAARSLSRWRQSL